MTVRDLWVGCYSVLEVRYLRTVERAHGLPAGVRQADRPRPGGRYYDDVRYAAFGTSIELDGRVDVSQRLCAVEAQVGAVLRDRRWTGHVRACGPDCAVTRQ